MEIISAEKERVVIDREEYERLYDLVCRVAQKNSDEPCGCLVEMAKNCNRALMASKRKD